MKKLFLAALMLAGYSATTSAQVTLTGATMNPVLGNSFTTVNCDTSAANLKLALILPDTGPAHMWDYSWLTTISYDTAVEVTCASTANCSMFLTSTNMAAKTLTNSSYVYNIINNDSVATTGYYYSASQNAILTNPMKTMKYPFTYLDSFTDAYAGSITYNPGTGTITAHETGNLLVKCDGYGTLKTPIATDSNVLRVRGVQTFIDSATILGFPAVITVAITTFQWYKLNYHSPVLSIMFTDQIAGPGSVHIKTVAYAKKYPLGVTNISLIENSLQLYPNPATDELNVNFEASNNENVRVSLIDIVGKEVAVLSNAPVNGSQSIRYNTSAFPKGVYMVRVQSGAETLTKKVVLQ